MEKSVLAIAHRAVLSLLSQYEDNGHSKVEDEYMNYCIKRLSASYAGYHLLTSSSVNLNDVRYQGAYMFLYFSALSHAVGYGIKNLDDANGDTDPSFGSIMLEIANTNENNFIKVCSIGGGPGTEVLGLHMFMKKFLKHTGNQKNVVLNATVIDKHTWSSAWDAISDHLDPSNAQLINMNYIIHDITNLSMPKEVLDSVRTADVLLAFKFISAVKGLPNAIVNLTNLLGKASFNSYLIYGDNILGGNTEIFRGIAEGAGFELIAEVGLPEFKPMGHIPQQENYLSDLEVQYDWRYQRKLSMYFIIMKKSHA